MELSRLHANVEAELNNIAMTGINMDNLDVAWKLVDMYKNCVKIKAMTEPSEVYMKSEYINQLEGLMKNASPEEWKAVSEWLNNR